MKQLDHLVSSILKPGVSYNTLIDGNCLDGKMDKAMKLFASMVDIVVQQIMLVIRN
jgi:pentatricopeptide repeat protein